MFSKQCNALKKEIDKTRLDRYEAELDKRVLTTPSKQSDILLMFGLKALKPDVYREKITGPLIGGDIKIIMAIPGYDEKLRLGNVIEGEIINGSNEGTEKRLSAGVHEEEEV